MIEEHNVIISIAIPILKVHDFDLYQIHTFPVKSTLKSEYIEATFNYKFVAENSEWTTLFQEHTNGEVSRFLKF